MYVHVEVVNVQFDRLKWSKTSISTGRNLMVLRDCLHLLEIQIHSSLAQLVECWTSKS